MWDCLGSYYDQLYQGSWYLQVLSMILALLFIYNIYLSITLCENKDLRECSSNLDQHEDPEIFCGVDDDDLEAYNDLNSNNQSPIDIDSCHVVQNCFDMPLTWSGYNQRPSGICLENNGHTLLVRAAFRSNQELPCIYGADLLGCYIFCEISFRWSWFSGYGSEHTIDSECSALEMQCLHADVCNNTRNKRTSSQSLLIVSYLFKVCSENPFLDVITPHLIKVQKAGQCCEIDPFPLEDIMPEFCTDFFSYHGSLTEPPYHSGAEWFIYPKQQTISERQLHEFHKLCNHSGSRIARNARSIQKLQGRCIQYNQMTRS